MCVFLSRITQLYDHGSECFNEVLMIFEALIGASFKKAQFDSSLITTATKYRGH